MVRFDPSESAKQIQLYLTLRSFSFYPDLIYVSMLITQGQVFQKNEACYGKVEIITCPRVPLFLLCVKVASLHTAGETFYVFEAL